VQSYHIQKVNKVNSAFSVKKVCLMPRPLAVPSAGLVEEASSAGGCHPPVHGARLAQKREEVAGRKGPKLFHFTKSLESSAKVHAERMKVGKIVCASVSHCTVAIAHVP
jgi:hypothetical protein